MSSTGSARLSERERMLLDAFVETLTSDLGEAGRALELDEVAWSFSVHVHTPAWLTRRREVRSFFITEVDRDKVVVAGRS